MTQQKPEWFEIADNEAPVKNFTSTRRLPIWILSFALLFVGAGAVVSNTQENPSVFSSELVSVQENPVAPSTSSAPVIAITQSSPATSASTPKMVIPTMATPSIGQMPIGGDEDDDDEDDDDDDDDDH